MKTVLFRTLALLLLLITAAVPACAASKKQDLSPLFEEALSALQTPAEQGLSTGTYALHTGDTAFVPCVAPAITPCDEQNGELMPIASGTFVSSDEHIVSVSADGKMTGAAEGTASVRCTLDNGSEYRFEVTVSDDTPPESIKAYLYVLNREYYTQQKAKLGKSNVYTKWYYKSKKAVGWCGVFTIYCANASGNLPLGLKEVDYDNPPEVQFFREGQVGHQYDGFLKLERFVGVPKPGYLLIYTNSKNGYRYEHIASVVDVQDRGDGIYAVTTVEGNMSSTVMRYAFLYDSNKDNHVPGTKSQKNISGLPDEECTDPLTEYGFSKYRKTLSVTGFCATW